MELERADSKVVSNEEDSSKETMVGPEPKKIRFDEQDTYIFNSTNVLRVFENELSNVLDLLVDVLQIPTGKCEDVLNYLIPTVCDGNDEEYEAYGTKLVVNYWIMRCPYASWRWLIWQFERTNEVGQKQATRLQPYAENLSDPTLTLINVSHVVKSVKQISTLQNCFDVPPSKMSEIEKLGSTEAQCREEIINYWLMYSPFASWEWLAGSLYYHQEEEALRAVKPFVTKKKEFNLTTEHLQRVFDEAEDWRWRYKYICKQLQIPKSIVKQALFERGDKRYNVDPTQSLILAQLFLDSHPVPSWKLVAQALWSEEQWEAVEIIHVKYFREINLEDICVEAISTVLNNSGDVEYLPLPSKLKSKLMRMIETHPVIKLGSLK